MNNILQLSACSPPPSSHRLCLILGGEKNTLWLNQYHPRWFCLSFLLCFCLLRFSFFFFSLNVQNKSIFLSLPPCFLIQFFSECICCTITFITFINTVLIHYIYCLWALRFFSQTQEKNQFHSFNGSNHCFHQLQ